MRFILGGEISNIYKRDDRTRNCLLYTSDAADDLLCVDLGGGRLIKKQNTPEDCQMRQH